MEPPGTDAPDGIRDEKVKVLRAIRPLIRRTSCAASSRVIARRKASPPIRTSRRSRP